VRRPKELRYLRSNWPRYLWITLRHGERSYSRFIGAARDEMSSGKRVMGALNARIAMGYAKSADQARGFLGL
jgi:hypothetical protein